MRARRYKSKSKYKSKYKYMTYTYIFTIILLILILLGMSAYNSSYKHVDGFTPAIKRIYNPYIRHLRIYKDSVVDTTKTWIVRAIRASGLY